MLHQPISMAPIDDDPQWYAVRTAVRAERKALRELRLAGIEAYLPEYKIERFNRRKRISIVTTLCLFPGYLFARLSGGQFAAARSCKGVTDMLPGFPHEPVPMKAGDIAVLRAAQDDMKLDDTDEARRHRGETVKNTVEAMRKRLRDKQVRITEGPFLGHVADVEEVQAIDRIRVTLSLFGRPTEVTLDAGHVQEV